MARNSAIFRLAALSEEDKYLVRRYFLMEMAKVIPL